MKTITIKNKEYIPVVERIKEAHKLDENVSITTEILGENQTRITIKATVTFKGKVFTGHSQAEYGKGMMGGVALEVAETSAIGRALGFANIGIDTDIASADEMQKSPDIIYIKEPVITPPKSVKKVSDKTKITHLCKLLQIPIDAAEIQKLTNLDVKDPANAKEIISRLEVLVKEKTEAGK